MKDYSINSIDKSKKHFGTKFFVVAVIAIFISGITFGQAVKQNKTEAMIKQLENKLKIEKAKLAKAEKAAAVSDSLIETGTKMMDESDAEYAELDEELKTLDKEFNANVKPLQKRMNSKDKDVATEANTEYKNIDTKYKADQKALTAKQKAIEKKALTGKLNLDKGKASKKMTAEALKNAQASVAALEEKIEALKSGDEEGSTSKDKGKKKK